MTTLTYADSYQQAMAMQNVQLYGETFNLPEPEKVHYVCKGQEYLRAMAREQLQDLVSRSWLNKMWFTLDPESSLTGVEARLENPEKLQWLPMTTMVRLYADEDLNRYLDCGWALPIKIELESTYYYSKQMKFNAKIDAPFNDDARLEVGSQIQWTPSIHSHVCYSLCNRENAYDGLTMGLGIRMNHWVMNIDYDLTSDYIELHRLSIARSF